MNGQYFKMGEFAQICGVKKATLVHYEKIGLLVPCIVGENGYFYYSPSQMYEYEVIAALKEMDIPLLEIKEYLTNQDVDHCRQILQKNLENLQERRRRIEHIEALIQNTLKDTDHALRQECDKFEIVTQEQDEYLFVYELHHRTERVADNLKEARVLIDYCKKSFYNATLNVSEVVLQEDVENNSFKKSYGAFRMSEKVEGENLFIKPAGTYATVCKRSGGDAIASIYRELKAFALENGYRVCGNAYEEDLLSYLTEHDRDNYLLRCYIQVEPDTQPQERTVML